MSGCMDECKDGQMVNLGSDNEEGGTDVVVNQVHNLVLPKEKEEKDGEGGKDEKEEKFFTVLLTFEDR